MEVGLEPKGKQIMQKPIRPNAIFLHKRTDKVFDRVGASTLFTHLKLSDFRVTIGTIARMVLHINAKHTLGAR